MVISKLKGRKSPQITCPEMLKAIVEELFPYRPKANYEITWQDDEVVVPPL